jgi:hypothetical protein
MITFTALILFLFSLFVFWNKSLRYWHIGYGVILVFWKEGGTVWIASRLIGSPAHRHGIENFSRLVSVDGKEIKFSSLEEFQKWMKKTKPKRGDKVCWITVAEMDGVKEEIKAIMTPELILSEIPVYWDPNRKNSPLTESDPNIYGSLRYCSKIGEYHFNKAANPKGFSEAHFC